MLVCHCYRVTDRDLREAAARGARSAEELDGRCMAGRGCGNCAPAVDQVLAACHGAAAGGEIVAGSVPVFARADGHRGSGGSR